MSSLLFPAHYFTEQNQELLKAMFSEFSYLENENENLTIDDVLGFIDHRYVHDDRVIKLTVDYCYGFEETSEELRRQRIPYDIVYECDQDSNPAVEFYRDYMENPEFVNTDMDDKPMITINTIRSIIDAQDENLTDIEIMDKLITEINYMDFLREGNRIQDLA